MRIAVNDGKSLIEVASRGTEDLVLRLAYDRLVKDREPKNG